MFKSFLNGFTKTAKKKEENKHYVRRMLLGNQISSAIEARKGKKLESFGHAFGHQILENLKGTGLGAAGGAAAGAATAALTHRDIKHGAGAGAYLGGAIGSTIGGLKGHFDAKATEIHNKYSKNK